MSGVVVDACVMQRFLLALVEDRQDDVAHLFACLSEGLGFAIDSTDKMLNQWRETCKHLLMEDWIVRGIQNGYIRVVDPIRSQRHKKQLMQALGFPYQTRHEGVYVEVATASPPHLLISEDIDFWEPTAKRGSAEVKSKFISQSRGGVARYLNKEMGITVVNVSQAIAQLNCSS
ncbi:hypothetical protein [Terriglobus tenax]|uniref:hypothetical protein n=1 Tax=Terriglobus tenax TaxID=1111115 RepID=UPI0021E01962|nr:hypothetical protein [Terriglobus tenax]